MRYLAITFLIFTSLTGLWAQDADHSATVYQTVNVRSGPGTQFEIVGQLNDGDQVPVLGRESAASRWLYVPLPDGSGQGWVAVFTVTLNFDPESLDIIEVNNENTSSPPANGVHITAFGRVNVRNGPGINYDIVSQLEADDEAEVIARNNYNNDWLYIENEAIVGWIAYFTVSVRGNPDDLPVMLLDDTSGELVPPLNLVRANYRIHLHLRPALRSRVVGIVPFAAQTMPLAITADGRWLLVSLDGVEGWAWTSLFDVTDEQIALIPR